MSRLPRDLEHQTIRETERWFVPKMGKRDCNHVRILKRKSRMLQKHLDRRRATSGVKFVNGFQNPEGLRQDEVRNPRPPGHERLRGRHLPCVVARHQADQDVRVDGAHASPACGAVCPPSNRTDFSASEICRKAPGGSLPSCTDRLCGPQFPRPPRSIPRRNPGPIPSFRRTSAGTEICLCGKP